ncbi:MAG: BON domain-containing protein [Luteolibacter sp.]|uniref:BON domain-containing protein n=1 Tax=Luteolibacter sp. TaxID=1962973 RepID=UPI0032632FEB
MKPNQLNRNHHRLIVFTVTTLGASTLLFASPQLAPRGDSEIAEFIQMDANQDKQLDGARIHVRIKDGMAFLTGTADSLAQAERATARAVASVGVRAVVNQIQINPQPPAEILRAAKSALDGQKMIVADKIRVSISGHRLSLVGSVGNWSDRDFATEIVSKVRGAVAVDNELTVTSQATAGDSQIAEQLRFMIRRDPLCEGLDLTVEVKSGIVRISGEVGSFGEIDRLVRRSRLPGVTEVRVSRLSVNRDLAMEGVADKNYSEGESIAALRDALDGDARIHAGSINVAMDGNTVTLTGSVARLEESDAAGFTARGIPGVLRVVNQLDVVRGADASGSAEEFKVASPPLVMPPVRN